MKKYIRLLSIAGFDGSGGAGIQADLKTFAALGCYGMSALTSLPIQNTQGVKKIYSLEATCLREQIEAIIEDIGVDAIKIGMLERAELITAVADSLKDYLPLPIVCDPVMVAKSGDRLLNKESIQALKDLIFPIATVITPNLPEAEELLGNIFPINNHLHMEEAAIRLSKMGPLVVVLKGGHSNDQNHSSDLIFHSGNDSKKWLHSPRIATNNTHGTGCSFSSAIAAYLGHGYETGLAIEKAKEYISQAITSGAEYNIGHGNGPVHHFFNFWR